MVTETEAEKSVYEVDPDLFDAPSSGEGGAFWPKKEGTYRAQLLRFEKGPEFENERDQMVDGVKTKVKVKEATVRWIFALYRMQSGKRLTYEPAEGQQQGETIEVETDGLTSRKFSKGSNAGKWLRVLLGRDIDWTALTNAPEAEAGKMKAALMQEAIGKWASASFGTSRTSDKVALRELSMLDLEED